MSATAGGAASLPGLAVDGVATWLEQFVPGERPLEFSLVANGRSNITYAVTAESGRRFILRRPPLGVVHASAHDVGREYRIMSALNGGSVPVPRMVGMCADEGVIGAPFYMMDFVDGVVMDNDDGLESLDEAARERFVIELATTLAHIHAVRLTESGLDDLIKPNPLVRRQLRRWGSQLENRQDATSALLRELQHRLEADAPASDNPVLVHGDYRPGNLIVDPQGKIAAVLDWELAAAGDGLVDLGWLAAWWEEGLEWTPAPRLAPGSLQRLLDAYEAAGGLDLNRLPYYQAFAYWRLSCIALGVYERFAAASMGASDPSDLEALRAKPEKFARMAQDLLS